MMTHIEYDHGYKNAINELCIYLKDFSNQEGIKVNKYYLNSMLNLILTKGFKVVRDTDTLYFNLKNEVFDNYEECKKSNVKKKRKR